MNVLASRAQPLLPPQKPLSMPLLMSQKQECVSVIVHKDSQAKYICSCGNNDANTCTCSTCRNRIRLRYASSCSYHGRCVEPLAWNIEHELVRYQDQCPLFTTIPKELRDLIFEFALTDSKDQSLESLMKRNASNLKIKIDTQKPTNDIAVNLLRTCRSIYLDTWTLPLSLNSFMMYRVETNSKRNSKFYMLLPWQVALTQSIDITLQQIFLEGDRLERYMTRYWRPKARHKGIFITPMRYNAPTDKSNSIQSRAIQGLDGDTCDNFASIPIAHSDEPRHFLSHLIGEVQADLKLYDTLKPQEPPPFHSAMRVMRAKPLTHLTLRLQHQDWWTWADPPDSTDDTQRLALDPSVGNPSGGDSHASRPTASRMRALAQARRAGNHPDVSLFSGWASKISAIPDLRSLELVLETFRSKKAQLEDVVAASKTWVFPLEGTGCELVWDGEVRMGAWSMSGLRKEGEGGGEWWKREMEFEVRTVRFVRRRGG